MPRSLSGTRVSTALPISARRAYPVIASAARLTKIMLPPSSVTTTASGIASRTSCLLGTTFILRRRSSGVPPREPLAPGSVPSGLLAILALSGGRVLVNPRHLSRGGVLEHFSGRPERTLFMSTVPTIPQEVTDDREDRDDHEGDDVLYEAHGWERSTMAAVP